MSRFIWLSFFLFFSIFQADLRSDEQKQAQPSSTEVTPLPGHSLHGEAFDDGPRQQASFMANTGNVRFTVTTTVPDAQQFFDQGVGQLHGFLYYEAERSFRQVAKLDPNCAMAYWGMAMANINNEKRAKELIRIALEKKDLASSREQSWITSLATFYKGDDTFDARCKYIRDLESLVQDQPHDVEAKAFLVFQIWKNSSWTDSSGKKSLLISSYQAVDALLDQIFQIAPMHPAHHYRIHLWDDEKPARALISASLNGQSSAGIAHMWHMPGHTYSKLHRYGDAIWQQEASARVDHAYTMRDRVLPGQIHNYAHNNEWLIRNLIFLGQATRARELAQNMIDIPRHPMNNDITKDSSCAAYGRTRMRQILVGFELWHEIIARQDSELFQPIPENSTDEIQRLSALAIASFSLAKPDDGNRHLATMEKWLADKRAGRYAAADAAEQKARTEKKPDHEVTQAMAGVLLEKSAGLKEIETSLTELRGYSLLAAAKIPEALVQFNTLKEIPGVRKESLARAFSLCNDHEQAVALARKAVESGVNEILPQATLVEVLYRSGKKPEATADFAKLRTLAGTADLDLPIFVRLKPLADELQLPVDWRTSAPPSTDVGIRPDLNSLGPFLWQPHPAAAWSLINTLGETVTLEQFRGKPLIIIFYLGSGCLHCVEQLQKFSARSHDFQSAGLEIVAISSESLDSLKASIGNLEKEKAIPFPLFSDASLEVFKKYRVYDDFENRPLHGTILIDSQGLVRWQDIRFEPFRDPEFLLKESTRLVHCVTSSIVTKTAVVQ